MKAMVLCAGLGTRLRPLTNHWPKPAMPLLGQPLFRYTLATLKAAGITDIGINTHHLPKVMQRVAREECTRAGCTLTVVHESEIQGTGGGIRGLRDFLSDGPFLVVNGDVLFAADFRPFIAAHLASKADATMVLLPMPAGEKFNPVELDATGCVRRIAGKGPGGAKLSPWHFCGVHVMSPAIFDFIAPSGPTDINHDTYLSMLAQGRTVGSFTVTGQKTYWSDLGTPSRYGATHQDLLFGQVPMEVFGESSPFHGLVATGVRTWVHPSAQLSDAKVTGPAWFGEGAKLGAHVRIGAATSIGRGAVVPDGVALNRVSVLDGVRVPKVPLLEDCIVGPDGPTAYI
ncbi:MAG: NDP-sugar synthase [Myxococcaceae bacterium]|nr:NDP-sugar synthase [Myxococcaceae bacterium]